MSTLSKRKHFEGKEGMTLKVHLDEQTTAELTQIDYNDKSNEQVDGFSAVFEGPVDQAFDQDLHRVEHPDAGPGELFLVPVVGGDPQKRHYELTVANLKDKPPGGDTNGE
jgi:hypothetical protein